MSMAHQIKKIVKEKSPFFIPVYTIKKSSVYSNTLSLLSASETWSSEQIEKWRLKKVSEIVDYAFKHCAFYRELYSKVGYSEGDIRNWNDFDKLPLISKDDIKQHFDDFSSDEIDKIPHNLCFTGGSTGQAMKFLLDKSIGERERAMFHYYWSKHEFSYGDRCILFKDQEVSPNKLYVYDRLQNYKKIGSLYVNDPSFTDRYVREFNNFNADFIQAYPSSLYSLAKNMKTLGIKSKPYKTIFLASEEVNIEHNDLIAEVFSPTEIVYHYGHSECAALAFKYPNANYFGFSPIYGHIELFYGDKKVNSYDETGEIVATTYNKSMPFIRYRTGDYTAYANYSEPGWMSNYIATYLIQGRKQDYIVTKKDTLIAVITLRTTEIPELGVVADYQYEQKEKGKVTINILEYPKKKLTKDQLLGMKMQFEKLFDYLVDVEIQITNDIKRSNRGKRIAMIQHLNTDLYR
jgi:phenylacetate-CoA ligase